MANMLRKPTGLISFPGQQVLVIDVCVLRYISSCTTRVTHDCPRLSVRLARICPQLLE